ncbi:unnamed protein product [Lymnaea stagnalis]|uniref:ZP domain-containing protein n=1 Tax=Lymnaea stagnalis TaxID=6523 RepID=A0AAV2HH07_LYMST
MTNKITVHTDLDVGGGVVFGEDYTIDLSCTIPKHQSVDGSFQGVTAEPVLETSENKTMGYILKEYETADYTKEITSFPVLIPSNRNIFFEVSLKAEDRINSSYGIKVDECKATPSLDPNNPTHFTMISNNCPAVSAVHILTNPSLDVFRFYIHSFHFSGADNKDNYVYVHCDVTICPKTSCPNGCSVPGRRRRRSNASPLVTLTIGPYIFVDDKLH